MDLLSFFKKSKKSSREVAASRLKVCIIHDKTQGSPEILDMIRNEIIRVIEKYVEFDRDSLDIQLTHSEGSKTQMAASALVANIPIRRVKRTLP